jgi:glyoxylase-like metal-dependent hydrolase (beta-lactamase superfamily II)/rhodanese-related sulfurtransferase
MENSTLIKQFFDKTLAHSSYAILGGREVILIDPGRDPSPYLAFASEQGAAITGVIETHPHADFISSHLEFSQRGAIAYASKLTAAEYPHRSFDNGDEIRIGNALLKAINTPGHSPDSISVLLEENGHPIAVFTGDTLFSGDVGRPDLRENTPGASAKKEELARAMFSSTRNKLMKLPDNTLVYPSHGPGSLCGKHISSRLWSTIGDERRDNYALQPMKADDFVNLITSGQPFIPSYFGYDVALNKKGAQPFEKSLSAVITVPVSEIEPQTLIVDTRAASEYRNSYLPNSINIPDGNPFETWLGTIIAPDEPFYLLSGSAGEATALLARTAKIGYEANVKAMVIENHPGKLSSPLLDISTFKKHTGRYTIIDVRNENESRDRKIFSNAIELPLPRLRDTINTIPREYPIVVHCAGGYRSAIGSSIISRSIPGHTVYDLGQAIDTFK